MNLANYAQFEREMISERTRDALRHLKSQGVRLGHAPYGYQLGTERDTNGRRILVPLPNEQEVIGKIMAMHSQGIKMRVIARLLNEEGTPARRGKWFVNRICLILNRAGLHKPRKNAPRVPKRYDPEAAQALARQLREEGHSLSQIGAKLTKAKLTPQRGGKWHPAQVSLLLKGSGAKDWTAAARRAVDWRAEGMTLHEIGVRLTMDGYQTKEGGMWFPATVASLLRTTERDSRDIALDSITLVSRPVVD